MGASGRQHYSTSTETRRRTSSCSTLSSSARGTCCGCVIEWILHAAARRARCVQSPQEGGDTRVGEQPVEEAERERELEIGIPDVGGSLEPRNRLGGVAETRVDDCECR